jgi:hypothetical protein
MVGDQEIFAQEWKAGDVFTNIFFVFSSSGSEIVYRIDTSLGGLDRYTGQTSANMQNAQLLTALFDAFPPAPYAYKCNNTSLHTN